MVEYVEGIDPEIQSHALGDLVVLQDGHVPVVEVRRIHCVAPDVGDRSDTGLDKPGARRVGHVSDGIRGNAAVVDAGVAGARVSANSADGAADVSGAGRVKERAVTCGVQVPVRVDAGLNRDRLSALEDVGTAP